MESDSQTATGVETLPRGRHGLSAEFVRDDQRRRLVLAMAACCAEQGYAKTSVTDVVERARVSRKVFYDQFADKQECALGAFEELAAELCEAVERACMTRAAWPDRVGAGVGAAIERFTAEPAIANFLTIGVVGVGPRGIAAQHRVFERLARGLSPGRAANPRADWMSKESEWGLVAYLSTLVARRLTGGEPERVSELAPELIESALTPYIGLEEARAAARRATGA